MSLHPSNINVQFDKACLGKTDEIRYHLHHLVLYDENHK